MRHVSETQMVDVNEAARRLGFARRTLENWRSLGVGPKAYRVGRAVRYDVADLEAWIAAQRVPHERTAERSASDVDQ